MKFGILSEVQPGPRPWAPDRENEIMQSTLDQVILADQLGWDQAWFVEHHFLTDYSISSCPEVIMAYLAGKTQNIRLGHGVVQANPPTNHVVRVAERVATLDLLSQGRIDLGLGRALTRRELEGFRMDPEDTRPAQEEVIEMLFQIFTKDTFSWDGKYYQVPEVSIYPKAVQKPHPPMWMACTQPASFQLAAERGLGVLAFGWGRPEALKQPFADYRETIARTVTPSGAINNQIAPAVPMFCADTDDEALEKYSASLLMYLTWAEKFIIGDWKDSESATYQFYRDLSQHKLIDLPPLPESEIKGLSPEAATIKSGVAAGLFCVGSPETCSEFVESWGAAGIDQMAMLCQLGVMQHDDVTSSMRLFTEKVASQFRSAAV